MFATVWQAMGDSGKIITTCDTLREYYSHCRRITESRQSGVGLCALFRDPQTGAVSFWDLDCEEITEGELDGSLERVAEVNHETREFFLRGLRCALPVNEREFIRKALFAPSGWAEIPFRFDADKLAA